MMWEKTVLSKEQMAEINANMPPEAKYGDVFLEISKATAEVTGNIAYKKGVEAGEVTAYHNAYKAGYQQAVEDARIRLNKAEILEGAGGLNE